MPPAPDAVPDGRSAPQPNTGRQRWSRERRVELAMASSSESRVSRVGRRTDQRTVYSADQRSEAWLNCTPRIPARPPTSGSSTPVQHIAARRCWMKFGLSTLRGSTSSGWWRPRPGSFHGWLLCKGASRVNLPCDWCSLPSDVAHGAGCIIGGHDGACSDTSFTTCSSTSHSRTGRQQHRSVAGTCKRG